MSEADGDADMKAQMPQPLATTEDETPQDDCRLSHVRLLR